MTHSQDHHSPNDSDRTPRDAGDPACDPNALHAEVAPELNAEVNAEVNDVAGEVAAEAAEMERALDEALRVHAMHDALDEPARRRLRDDILAMTQGDEFTASLDRALAASDAPSHLTDRILATTCDRQAPGADANRPHRPRRSARLWRSASLRWAGVAALLLFGATLAITLSNGTGHAPATAHENSPELAHADSTNADPVNADHDESLDEMEQTLLASLDAQRDPMSDDLASIECALDRLARADGADGFWNDQPLTDGSEAQSDPWF